MIRSERLAIAIAIAIAEPEFTKRGRKEKMAGLLGLARPECVSL
jgi:hypothetical protein